jgi:hypothetical protein
MFEVMWDGVHLFLGQGKELRMLVGSLFGESEQKSQCPKLPVVLDVLAPNYR